MAPQRISVNEEGSVLGGLVGFEELVEWRGPVGSSGELGPSQLYTMEGEDFFFPLIDEDAAHSRMAYRRPKDKHARFKKEPKIQGCEEKDEAQIPQYKTTVLESRHLDGIRKNYHIPLSYKIIYPEVLQRIHTLPVICVTTYVAHLRAGLRFPLHPLFVDICKYYGVQLGHLMLNVIRTTVGFLMACRAFGCECLLKL